MDERSRPPLRRVAFFMPSLAGGGAERVTLALAEGLAGVGIEVDIVLAARRGELLDEVPPTVSVVDLKQHRVAATVLPLARYLRRARPDVLVSVMAHTSVFAVLASKLARYRPVVVAAHNTISTKTQHSSQRRERLVPLMSAVAFRAAAKVIAVSHGVADDLAATLRMPRDRIDVLPNLIDYAAIGDKATTDLIAGPLAHPLVVGIGRLVEQKGFDVLIEAVHRMSTACSVVVLGDGADRAGLEAAIRRHGLQDRVYLPGFVANPYPYLKTADVFVLSSRWEGLPTVLLEALYFPVRIVSTDCRSGPREILADSTRAELVPVGDPSALAAALDRAVVAERPEVRQEEWMPYDKKVVLQQFIDYLQDAAAAVSRSRA